MKLVIRSILIGILFEFITLISRFYFGLEATRDTTIIGNFTGGVRIHHGYLGVLLMVITFISLRHSGNFSNTTFSAAHWMFVLGGALLLSDLIHHFVVLQLITGDPQFDLFYSDP